MGEVRDVDARARQIELSTDVGRKFIVKYDTNTRVSYRQRNYAVANLEPGDYQPCARNKTAMDGISPI